MLGSRAGAPSLKERFPGDELIHLQQEHFIDA